MWKDRSHQYWNSTIVEPILTLICLRWILQGKNKSQSYSLSLMKTIGLYLEIIITTPYYQAAFLWSVLTCLHRRTPFPSLMELKYPRWPPLRVSEWLWPQPPKHCCIAFKRHKVSVVSCSSFVVILQYWNQRFPTTASSSGEANPWVWPADVVGWPLV